MRRTIFLCLLSGVVLSSCALVRKSGFWFSGRLEQAETVHAPFEWPRAETMMPLERAARRHDYLLALLVVQGGRLVGEYYAPGRSPEEAVNVKSVSKSVLSALVGIAIEEGLLAGIDQPISDFYPDLPADKRGVRIRHLLSMSAGFAFAENVDNNVYKGRDWTAAILAWPMSDPPGEAFNYATISTHLLSGILTRASGKRLVAYAQEKLFDPMGISIRAWVVAPEGVVMGGSGMYMTPSDMAAFGQLYLQKGAWRGVQLVPERWVEASIRPRYGPFPGARPVSYGFLWWLGAFGDEPIVYAEGWGGQYIIIFPRLDAVVVTACRARWWNTRHDRRRTVLFGLVEQTVLPLLRARTGADGPSS